MNFDLMNILFILASAIYYMLPAYLANISAMAFSSNTPLDFNKVCFDGRRWIGNGVTWGGVIGGTLIGTLVGLIQGILSSYVLLEPHLTIITGILFGFTMGLGALLGDAVGSFIKRRIGIERGRPAPLLDQLDFVFGALLLSSLVYFESFSMIIVIIIITPILHLLTNMLGYLLGFKEVWY